MIVAYCLILVISGFNPLLFFKRYLPTMLLEQIGVPVEGVAFVMGT